MRYWLALLVVVVIAAGCCKKKLYCQSGNLTIAFVGYLRSESRSISVKRFELGGQFSKAIDSGSFIYGGTQPVNVKKPDTLWFSEYTVATSKYVFTGIKPGNDWQIYLPFLRETYILTGLGDDGNRSMLVKCNDDKTSCTADMANLYVNNVWAEGDTLYIVKTKK